MENDESNNQNGSPKRPLSNLQTFLSEAKVVAVLLRDLLVEVKEIIIVLTMILAFVAGALGLLTRISH